MVRLDHRGAKGADPNVGDGAGVLLSIPHEFFEKELKDKEDLELPSEGRYGVGLVYLSQNPTKQALARERIENICNRHGQIVIGWRSMVVDRYVRIYIDIYI